MCVCVHVHMHVYLYIVGYAYLYACACACMRMCQKGTRHGRNLMLAPYVEEIGAHLGADSREYLRLLPRRPWHGQRKHLSHLMLCTLISPSFYAAAPCTDRLSPLSLSYTLTLTFHLPVPLLHTLLPRGNERGDMHKEEGGRQTRRGGRGRRGAPEE